MSRWAPLPVCPRSPWACCTARRGVAADCGGPEPRLLLGGRRTPRRRYLPLEVAPDIISLKGGGPAADLPDAISHTKFYNLSRNPSDDHNNFPSFPNPVFTERNMWQLRHATQSSDFTVVQVQVN